MLVLSRKMSQQIRIGEVIVTVLKSTGSQVRLGIEAPEDVLVLRGELDRRDSLRLRDELSKPRAK